MEYSDEMVERIWEKGRAIPDKDPTEWRKDECGAWISHDQYGSQRSEFGWKIENISLGEPVDPDHLRPFQRDNAFDRATGRPHCRVTADRGDVPATARIDSLRNRPAD